MDDSDRLALHELAVRYGDTLDDGDWEGLSAIFTEDATFDLNGNVLGGLATIRDYMEHHARRPLNHVIAGIRVDESADGVTLISRAVVVRPTGVSTGRYRDTVVKGPDGWRITQRVFRPVGS